MAVVVDSSLWVHQLRKSGDRAKRAHVHVLLENGRAAWCAPGALAGCHERYGAPDAATVRGAAPGVRDFAGRLGARDPDRGRAAGITAPFADLLIIACAKEHALDLAHDDTHFSQLEQLEA